MSSSTLGKSNPRECVHKETLLGRWVVEDENGLHFAFCNTCYRRVRHLKGYKTIDRGDSIYRKEK